MSTTFEIPLSPTPQRLFISLGGTVYQITVKWNPPANCWVLDFADENGNDILDGVAMVSGVDLFEQYGYLNFGGQLIALNETDPNPPTFDNLGLTGHLVFVTSP